MTKLAIAAVLAASLSIAAPAMAQEVTRTVAYGDLDISTPAGTQALAQRLDAGADAACERPDIRDLKSMTEFQSCKTSAVAAAEAQLAVAK